MPLPRDTESKRVRARLERSPINCLIASFSRAPFRFAPERSGELEGYMKTLGVRVRLIWPGNSFLFFADTSENLIGANICALERLWAYAYGYCATLNLLATAPRGGVVKRPPPATRLLQWAHTSAFSKTEVEWPDSSPRPDQSKHDPNITIANEAFLCMAGWILLHEFAHLVRNDGPYEDNNESFNHTMEHNADDWATRMAINQWRSYRDDPAVLIKRGVSIGFALFLLAANQAFLGRSLESRTHPSAIERIRKFFAHLETNFSPSFGSEVLKIQDAIVALLFGVMAFGRKPKNLILEHDTVSDCLDYIESAWKPIRL